MLSFNIVSLNPCLTRHVHDGEWWVVFVQAVAANWHCLPALVPGTGAHPCVLLVHWLNISSSLGALQAAITALADPLRLSHQCCHHDEIQFSKIDENCTPRLRHDSALDFSWRDRCVSLKC